MVDGKENYKFDLGVKELKQKNWIYKLRLSIVCVVFRLNECWKELQYIKGCRENAFDTNDFVIKINNVL